VTEAPPAKRPGQPFVVQRLAGKLLGARVGALRTVGDWFSIMGAWRSVSEQIPGPIVACADYRRLQVMDEEVAAAVVEGFRQFNLRVQRSAVMLPANSPTIRLQAERVLREAPTPGRRICVDVAEVKAWLTASLDATEQARMNEFLASNQF
jgi:hypothetical protein